MAGTSEGLRLRS